MSDDAPPPDDEESLPTADGPDFDRRTAPAAPYPDDFARWPLKERNAFFAAEAKAYRERLGNDARQWRARRDASAKSPGTTQADVALYPLKWHGEADDAPLQPWLVERTLPEVGQGLLPGQWGTFKSFTALDLAAAVMAKTSFAGRLVRRQGGVIFIACEGQSEMRLRLEGIAREKIAKTPVRGDALKIDPKRMPFVWVESCPPLTDDDALAKLQTVVKTAAEEMEKRFGLPLALVVIDTMMAAARFRDANDASETQRVVDLLRAVANEAKAFVLTVDHFGKDASTGTRNSSAKEAGADAVIAVLGERNLAGNVSNPRIAIRKVRGAPTGEEIPFTVRSVVIHDNGGFDAITTLVLDWRQPASEVETPRAKKAKQWTKSLLLFRRALENTLGAVGKRVRPFHDGPEVLAARREAVRDEFMKTYPADSRKAKGEAFRRCERDALAAGLLMARDLGPAESFETFFWPMAAES